MPRKREVLDVPGMPRHSNPIPTAVKVGGMVFSSALMGQDPETGETPPEPERQVELVFQHIRTIVEAAGGTTDDIAKMTVFLKDMRHREYVNREWLKMFPDEHDRPVRHTIRLDLPGSALVQIEFIAIL